MLIIRPDGMVFEEMFVSATVVLLQDRAVVANPPLRR